MSLQEKNKAIIEEAISSVMPNIVDMITNNKYDVSLEKLPDGSLKFMKDGKVLEYDEEMLTHLKLFVNMYVVTKNVQKGKAGAVTSQPSEG